MICDLDQRKLDVFISWVKFFNKSKIFINKGVIPPIAPAPEIVKEKKPSFSSDFKKETWFLGAGGKGAGIRITNH